MTSKEYRDRLHEIIQQSIFTLQDDRAAGLLRELTYLLEAQGVDQD